MTIFIRKFCIISEQKPLLALFFSGSETAITGKCLPQTSLNKNPYRVELSIGDGRRITGGYCQCVAGINGLCKHAAALACYVNLERTESCTDQGQKWLKPSEFKTSLYPKGQTIEELFHLRPVEPPSYQKNEAKLNEFLAILSAQGETNGMLYKTLTADPVVSVDNVETVPEECYGLVDRIFEEKQPICQAMASSIVDSKTIFKKISSNLSAEMSTFYEANVITSVPRNCQIFLSTINQSASQSWFLERRVRISASKAHKILRAKKSLTRLKYFFDSPPATKAMRYGLQMEEAARSLFETVSNKKVLKSGLIIKTNQSWLCASPDGLLKNENSCLEIKCPFTCENSKIQVDYIKDNKLVRNHPYFTQVQLQMYCSNSDLCYFFVYSSHDYLLVPVHRDEDFL